MSDARRSCCDPLVDRYGMPLAFVESVHSKPAIFLFEYEQQLDVLNIKLKEVEACEHYANQARIYLRTRCDDMLDCLAQAAEFLGWQPSFVEQIANEGCWENLLSKSKGPSS